MELKYPPSPILISGFESSNRTFMELKYHGEVPERSKERDVLIVPLWN